jgi:hypothetical protein
MMKTFVLFLALVGVAVLISTPAAGSKTLVGKKQKATVQFNDAVLLQGVTLKGEYLFPKQACRGVPLRAARARKIGLFCRSHESGCARRH